jgi:hypothetical protein
VKVDVLIPWWTRSGPERDRPRDWVLEKWRGAPEHYQVKFAVSDAEHWCKAEAVGSTLARCDGDVVIVADADVWCPGIHRAVQRVAEGRVSWAIPHRLVHRLDRASTYRLIHSTLLRFTLEPEPYGGQPYEGIRGGGIVVLDRRLALDVPMDSRIVGWGGEDHAWGYALTTIGGEPWRGSADLWHLWHEMAVRDRLGSAKHIGSMANEYVRRDYFAAQNDQAATRRLLDLGRGAWPSAD